MEISVDIPDEFAKQVVTEGQDLARLVLEALALEGYRSERLSESEVRRMLGFESRLQVHAFLKQHGVYLHYDLDDLKKDAETMARLRPKLLDRLSRRESKVG
jgi:predicted HTH domain antitoxin